MDRFLAVCLWVLVAPLAACGPADGPATERAERSGPERGLAIYRARCAWCHGPGLFDAPDLETRLASARERVAAFEEHAAAMADEDPGRWKASQADLEAILALPPGPERFARWLRTYVGDPGFDRTNNRMQRVPLKPAEAQALAEYLETVP